MTPQHTLHALCAAAALAFGLGTAHAEVKTLRVVPQTDIVLLDPGVRHRLRLQHRRHDDLRTPVQLGLAFAAEAANGQSLGVSPDGLTWRFTLRTGLRFHDGQPVTTTDVIASMRRWMDFDGGGRKLAADLTSMEAVDDANFTMSLKQPFPSMLSTLAAAPSPLRRHHAGEGPDGPAQAGHDGHRLRPIPLRSQRAGERRQDRVGAQPATISRATNRLMERPAAGW